MAGFHVPAVCKLHRQVLPTVTARIGHGLLENLYKGLLEFPGSAGWVAIDDEGKTIGFAAATMDVFTLERRLKKDLPVFNRFAILAALLAKPRELGELFNRIFSHRRALAKIGRDYPSLMTIGVAEAAREAGVGSELVKRVDLFFRRNGAERYFVDTLSSNSAAIKFYEKLNFEKFDEYRGNLFLVRKQLRHESK